MTWIILIVAGVLEIGWAIGLKYTDGFTRVVPTVLTILAMILSMGLLGLAVRSLPAGTAYAVWTGLARSALLLLAYSYSENPRRFCGCSVSVSSSRGFWGSS